MPEPADNPHADPMHTLQGKHNSLVILTFWSLLGVTTLVRLIYAVKLPLTGDEAYFWEWGRHPAPGYYDHPPIAGWILWFTRQILGETAAAVRLAAVITGTLVPAFIYRFTRDITGSARSAALTGLLAMGIPVLSVMGVLYTTDTPVLAAGTMGGYLFYRALKSGSLTAWILTGACFAIVLGSKFLGVPLLGAAGIYTTLHPGARQYLKKPGPWVAALISTLGLVPVVLWNASNQWATFTFNFASRHSSAPGIRGVLDYLAGQAFALSPVILVIAVPVLWTAAPVWRGKEGQGRDVPAFFALIIFAGFLAMSPLARIGMHWPAVAVPFLAAATGAACFNSPEITRTYIASLLTAWLITVVLFLIPLVPYMLPADWAWPLRPEKINTVQLNKLMTTPEESGRLVGTALEEMTDAGDTFVFTRSYALSSLVAFYTPGNPEVTVLGEGSVHGRNHLLWFKPADHTGENAVFVSYKSLVRESGFLLERFDRLEPVVDSGGPEGSLISIVKCYGYKGIR